MNFLDLQDKLREYKPRYEDETSITFYLEPTKRPEECENCFEKNTLVKHGNVNNREIRDTNFSGKFVGLSIKTPRYRCKNCGKTQIHKFSFIHEKRAVTNRLAKSIGKKSLDSSYSKIAQEYGFDGSHTVRRIGNEYLEELRNSPIMPPDSLAVLIVEVKEKDRLFFIDLDTYETGPSIIDIQDKVSDSAITTTFEERFEKNNIKMVLIEPYKNLKRWINGHLYQKNPEYIVFGPGILKENEERFREVFEMFTLNDIYYLTPKPLTTHGNKSTLQKFSKENKSFEPYYEFIKSTNLSFDNKCGSFTNLARTITVGNEHLELLEEHIENIDSLYEPISKYDTYSSKWNSLHEDIEKIVRKIEKQGNGYSYDALKNRLLYFNSATKPAVYSSSSEVVRYMQTGGKLPIVSGFHVPIIELLKEFSDN